MIFKKLLQMPIFLSTHCTQRYFLSEFILNDKCKHHHTLLNVDFMKDTLKCKKVFLLT